MADPTQASLSVDYTFANVTLAAAFLSEGLGQLTTYGTASLETTDGGDQAEVGILVINQNPCTYGSTSDFSIWSIVASSPPTE